MASKTRSVHSAELDENGRGPDGCAYNAFVDALRRDWDVVDEGPMEDLLGIEVEYLEAGRYARPFGGLHVLA